MEILQLVPSWFVWVAVILAILMVFTAVAGSNVTTTEYEYERAGYLLSPAESKFLKVLTVTVDGEYLVFSKVRVADVLKPRKVASSKGWIRAFNAIKAKHFDFVLCEPESFQVVAIIELDDSSHSSKSAMKRDAVKNSACKSAKIPLLRIKARSKYDPIEIDIQLKEVLGINQAP